MASGSAATMLTVLAVPPTADFSGRPNVSGRAPLTVSFTDGSTEAPTAWSWDFGDGSTSTVQSPSHTFAGGSYTVSLTASNEGGTNTARKADYILANTFSDVDTTNWAWRSIEACVAAGIVQGNTDGTYGPTAEVTRAQMAVFISRAMVGGDSHLPTAPAVAHFSDVPTSHWAFKYVECAYANNVVEGNTDGSYGPDTNVDRGQMAVFVARTLVTPHGEAGLASYTPPTTPSFPDVPTDFWAYKYVEYIKAQNVTQGGTDGKYSPDALCTRDQMAVYIERAFKLPN